MGDLVCVVLISGHGLRCGHILSGHFVEVVLNLLVMGHENDLHYSSNP